MCNKHVTCVWCVHYMCVITVLHICYTSYMCSTCAVYMCYMCVTRVFYMLKHLSSCVFRGCCFRSMLWVKGQGGIAGLNTCSSYNSYMCVTHVLHVLKVNTDPLAGAYNTNNAKNQSWPPSVVVPAAACTCLPLHGRCQRTDRVPRHTLQL